MDRLPEKRYPVNAKDYKLYEAIGDGVSASVYRAFCIPLNEIVAIKVLDLEKCNNDLDGIRHEVHTMSLIEHANVLQAYCSFTADHNLWVVMPYMAGGSCLHIMKSAFPEGFEEPVIATLLRETLKALVYLHSEGHIHRDVKAGNILMDSDGAIKLADFGVSACMFDTGDRQRSRNTFVGTPCWMAPEVMQQLHGYDFKADIWSLGITALELAHGHAPFSKYPPLKVFLMTIQNAPPGLDYERDKRFSKSFKEMVSTCLVKDPTKRPTAEKLLKHRFFKHARSSEYLGRTVLHGLAPLAERYRLLKEKEAALLVQNKALYEDKEQLSQQEYIRGISAWNFNLEDLKSQAAHIQDDDCLSHTENTATESQQSDRPNENGFDDLHALKNSLDSFPTEPLQAIKDCFDVVDDDEALKRLSDPEKNSCDNFGRVDSLQPRVIADSEKSLSGPLLQDKAISPERVVGHESRNSFLPKYQSDRSSSGPVSHQQKSDTNNLHSVEGAGEAAVIFKGRFKVTSGDLSPKEEIVKPLKVVEQINGNQDESAEAATNDLSQTSASCVERELEAHVLRLEQSIAFTAEELQKVKSKNAQLERELLSAATK